MTLSTIALELVPPNEDRGPEQAMEDAQKVLKSGQPAPLVFDSFEFFNMADKDTLEGPDAKSKAVGTGPYVFSEWSPGDHIRLLKNKNYWQSGRPYLDEIELRASVELAKLGLPVG